MNNPIASITVHHTVVNKPGTDKDISAVLELWAQKIAPLGSSRPVNDHDFREAFVAKLLSNYELLDECFAGDGPHPNYANIYVQHDVVGIVVVVQSTEEYKFLDLTPCHVQAEDAAGTLSEFAMWLAYTDNTDYPANVRNQFRHPEGFMTEHDFLLWELWPDSYGMANRIFVAVPRGTADNVVFANLIGPDENKCPLLLDYQIQCAKVRAMSRLFDANYRGNAPDSLRERRKVVDREIETLFESDPDDMSALLFEQRKEGGVLMMRSDLQKLLITLDIALGNMKRLQLQPHQPSLVPGGAPATAGAPPAPPEFLLYIRENERALLLRDAIEKEVAYFTITVDRLNALQLVFEAALSEKRLIIEKNKLQIREKQLQADQEKTYQNLVQSSFISAIGLALAVISTSTEYKYPELRWPLVAFSGAVGFALPLYVLHKHEKRAKAIFRWADALVCGTGSALTISWVWELIKYGMVIPPLWYIALWTLFAFFLRLLYLEVTNPGSLLFDVNELNDGGAITTLLRDPTEPLSQHIRSLFSSDDLREQLLNSNRPNTPAQQKALVDELNGLLGKSSFYSPGLFDQIALSQATLDLLEANTGKRNLIRLNRALLDEACEQHMAKRQNMPTPRGGDE